MNDLNRIITRFLYRHGYRTNTTSAPSTPRSPKHEHLHRRHLRREPDRRLDAAQEHPQGPRGPLRLEQRRLVRPRRRRQGLLRHGLQHVPRQRRPLRHPRLQEPADGVRPQPADRGRRDRRADHARRHQQGHRLRLRRHPAVQRRGRAQTPRDRRRPQGRHQDGRTVRADAHHGHRRRGDDPRRARGDPPRRLEGRGRDVGRTARQVRHQEGRQRGLAHRKGPLRPGSVLGQDLLQVHG